MCVCVCVCVCVYHRVCQFYTAPTLLRSLLQHGDEYVTRYDRSSLRVLGTVGEPIGEHAYHWYKEVGYTHTHTYTHTQTRKSAEVQSHAMVCGVTMCRTPSHGSWVSAHQVWLHMCAYTYG